MSISYVHVLCKRPCPSYILSVVRPSKLFIFSQLVKIIILMNSVSNNNFVIFVREFLRTLNPEEVDKINDGPPEIPGMYE